MQASKKTRQDFASSLPFVDAELFNSSSTSPLFPASAGVARNTARHIAIKYRKNIIEVLSLEHPSPYECASVPDEPSTGLSLDVAISCTTPMGHKEIHNDNCWRTN